MNPPYNTRDFVVDMDAVASATGNAPHTPRTWRSRGIMPAVDLPAVETPLWWASTIARWCQATGRTWDWARALESMSVAERRAGAVGGAPPEEWRHIDTYLGRQPGPAEGNALEWLDREQVSA